MEEQIKDFLEEAGFSADEFSISALSETLNIANEEKLAGIVCNLEDEGVMEDIANGDYDTIDIANRNQFNDSYSDMIYRLIEDDGFKPSDKEAEKKYSDLNDWNEKTSTKEKEEHILSYLGYNNDLDDENRSIVDKMLYDGDNIPRGYFDNELLISEFDLDFDFFIDYVNQL